VGADTVGELLLEAAVQETGVLVIVWRNKDYSNARRFDAGKRVPYDETFEN
jgi:hypothetical protein